MEHVFFKPWIGKDFARGGLWGKRILVLGESHYQWDKDIPLTQDLTIECITEQMKGVYKKQFWTNIAITFLNRHPSIEEKNKFWNSVAFYNYVQSNVGFGPRIRPTPELWAKSSVPYLEILNELQPNCIIVLGYQLWENLPSLGEKGPMIEGAEQKETWKYPIYGNAHALAYGIRHPSAGFSAWSWHPFVMRAIEFS